MGSYLIRGIVPFIYAYQLCYIASSSRFLSTYQLALHLSYLFCFPLIAAMQIAVRDASGLKNQTLLTSSPPAWWNSFFYTGLIPTTLLLLAGARVAVPLMKFTYHYVTPQDHVNFLILFFIGTWIGQFGNLLTIHLRSAKKSYLVTKNFFLAELIIMLRCTQLLLFFNIATPFSLGVVTVIFASVYTLANLYDVIKLNIKRKIELSYEKVN